MARTVPELSIIIPVVERHDDLRQLFSEYERQVEATGLTAEFLFVVDYRQREVLPVLRELQRETEHEVTLIRFGGTFGESSALTVGIRQARGEILVTLAAYFQVDPGGLVQAVEQIEAGADLVVGRRHPRADSWINRLQSRAFHWLVNLASPSKFHDISCSFRAMRRRVADELNIYGGLHRFIPILAVDAGFDVRELKLAHRSEDRATRYYGVFLYLKRVLDVATLFFLMRFTRRPLRFFGPIGLTLFGLGAAVTSYLAVYRLLHLGPIAGRPLLLLGVLLVVLGIQTLSLGLIGEIIIFTHARSLREYRIEEIISNRPQPAPDQSRELAVS